VGVDLVVEMLVVAVVVVAVVVGVTEMGAGLAEDNSW